MPNCRNCGARLSKFDTDICPVCGAKNPLYGEELNTQEVTSEISTVKAELSNYHRKSRKIACLLSCLIGWTGAGFFYLKYYMSGILTSILTLIFAGGLFAILYLLIHVDLFISLGIALGVLYFIHIVIGITFLKIHDLKDGSGEFLK